MRDARGIVAGVQHDQDLRIALAPLACGDKPFDHLPDLDGRDSGQVGAGVSRTASKIADQEVRPLSRATTTEYGQPGIIWCLALPRP